MQVMYGIIKPSGFRGMEIVIIFFGAGADHIEITDNHPRGVSRSGKSTQV